MRIPSKKVLELLADDRAVETKSAALHVLGELGSLVATDTEIGKAIEGMLGDPERRVRVETLKAIGKLGLSATLPVLLDKIKDGGDEGVLAAQAAAKFGARGTKALRDLMGKVAPGVRRFIASALAAGGTTSSETAAVEVLLDSDPGVVEASVRSLSDQIPTLSAAHRKAWANRILELLSDSDNRFAPASESAFVRILLALGDLNGVDARTIQAVLWKRILAPYPAEVRNPALQALSKRIAEPNKEQLRALIACASEADFRVVAPALVILRDLEADKKALSEWLQLFKGADVAARRMAIEKLGTLDQAEVAITLLDQTNHRDHDLREQALKTLTQLKYGRKLLTAGLLEAENADRAWPLAKRLVTLASSFDAGWRDQVFAKVCDYLEANDRRADPLLFLLRESDSSDLRTRLEERGTALRKKKDYATALHYFKMLVRDPAAGFPIRFELACCGLKLSSKDLDAESRSADPCLHQFATLGQNHEAELLPGLDKAKWLEDEDLYYLGFHFAEQPGRLGKLGAELLKRVVKRAGRGKLAQSAKSKLRTLVEE